DRRPHPLPRRRERRPRRRPVRAARRARHHGAARGLMLGVTLKGLAGRKLRALLTGLAIVLGVAMICGTFILTDTINGAFTSIFNESYKNADAVITGKTAFTNDNGNGVQAPSFPESLVAKVKALPDVNAAAGSVNDSQTKLVGRDGKAISNGGATIAVFDTPTLQKLLHKVGKLDIVRVQAKPGVSTSKLIGEIEPLLPPTAQIRDTTAQVKEDKKGINGFTSFIRSFLLAFAGIALFVGSFVIANTLSITIAQRVREFATLRTIGATRRQVLRSVIVESLVIGFVASVVGLFLGLALAKGLNAAFVAFGIDLPTAGTVFATRTVIVSLVVGTVITVLASLRPAIRATRVPPIAAVREGAEIPPGRFARFTPILSLVTLVLGILLLGYGVLGHKLPTVTRLASVGC